VRQFRLDPSHLYEANMYWPHRHGLAFTESLLPQALQAAPLFWLGSSPILAHNIVLLLTFPLSGLGLYLLARELGASRSGAFLGGMGFAFFGFHFEHLTQIGVVSVQWFPFVLWSFVRCVKDASAASLVGLAAFSLLQALSSGYYALLVGVVLVVSLGFFGAEMWRRGTLLKAVAAIAVAGLLTAAAAWPYRELRSLRPFTRSRQENVHWSARLGSFVNPGGYSRGLLYTQSALETLTRPGEALSPGFLVALAALLGFWPARRDRRAQWLLVLGVVCAGLALGPELRDLPGRPPGPFELVRRLPFFDMIRVPSRFGVGAVLAVDVLAALGFTRFLAARADRWRVGSLIMGLIVLAELAPESLSDHLRPAPEPTGFASFLAQAPRGPVLELPWEHEESGGMYMYWSTWHWQPMVNGHGTFPAPGNLGLGLIGRRFPAGFASRVLRCADVRYVVVHEARVGEGQRRLLEGPLPPGVQVAGRFERFDKIAFLDHLEFYRNNRPQDIAQFGNKVLEQNRAHSWQILGATNIVIAIVFTITVFADFHTAIRALNSFDSDSLLLWCLKHIYAEDKQALIDLDFYLQSFSNRGHYNSDAFRSDPNEYLYYHITFDEFAYELLRRNPQAPERGENG
jgi:hypothetical protein